MIRPNVRMTAVVVLGAVLPLQGAHGQEKALPGIRRPALGGEPRAYEARGIAFSPDVTLLATTTGTQKTAGCVVLWDLATRRPRWVAPQEAGVASAAYSPDASTIAIGMYSGPVKLLDAATGQTRATFTGHTSVVWRVAYSGDGATLASGSWDKTVRLWDPRTGAEKLPPLERKARVESLAFSSDGKLVSGAGAEPTVPIWDATTGAELHQLQGHGDSIAPCVAFTSDGKLVATGGWDGTVKFWDTASGNGWLRLHLRVEGVLHELRLSNDLRTLAAVSRVTHEIQLYDVDMHRQPPTPEQQQQIDRLLKMFENDNYKTREQAMHDLAKLGPIAAPELRKAMSSPDAEVRLRSRLALAEMCSPAPRAVLKGLTEAIYNMNFSPDGKFVAGASSDGAVRVWNVADGKEAAVFRPAQEE